MVSTHNIQCNLLHSNIFTSIKNVTSESEGRESIESSDDDGRDVRDHNKSVIVVPQNLTPHI